MLHRVAVQKISRVLIHQTGTTAPKRLAFTNASIWSMRRNGPGSKDGKSRVAVILLGAVIGAGSAIGNCALSSYIYLAIYYFVLV